MSLNNIRLLGNRVLVQPEKTSESEGGIILPKEEEIPKGTVIAVGPGAYLEDGTFVETAVAVGDVVVYPRVSAQEIEIDGEKALMLFEHDISGVIR